MRHSTTSSRHPCASLPSPKSHLSARTSSPSSSSRTLRSGWAPNTVGLTNLTVYIRRSVRPVLTASLRWVLTYFMLLLHTSSLHWNKCVHSFSLETLYRNALLGGICTLFPLRPCTETRTHGGCTALAPCSLHEHARVRIVLKDGVNERLSHCGDPQNALYTRARMEGAQLPA